MSPASHTIVLLLVLLASCASEKGPVPEEPASGPVPTVSAATAIADQFGLAIAGHDSVLVASLLGADVKIAEGGTVETREEYLSHHFHSDAAFLGAVERELLSRSATVTDQVAWIVSTSRLHGTFRNRVIDVTSAETLVLEGDDDNWIIVSVHWSSGGDG